MTSDADAMATKASTAYLKSVVLPIIVIGPDGAAKHVGTASIIASLPDRQLLILTAKHCIDDIKKVDQPYGDYAHVSTPDDFRIALPERSPNKKYRSLLPFPFHGETNILQSVRQYINPSSTWLSLAAFCHGSNRQFPWQFYSPQVGMRGFAVGYPDMKARTVRLEEDARAGHWEFEGQFAPRLCEVIKAEPHGSSMCRWPCFQINVPIILDEWRPSS